MRIVHTIRAPFAALLIALLATAAWAAEPLTYNRDVRPILADTCFACHGPDSAARKADLRLDRREQAVEMRTIVPGQSAESELIKRILSDDPAVVMPPPETKKSLTPAQKETLRRWIDEGAVYEPHWSLIPPARTEPPAVKNEAWIRVPLDRFILAELEAQGLEPAPEAPRHVLARRLSLDITGLPPDPELVRRFEHDASENAYEKLVDELLKSPQWGEHRGRYWLDAARYADTHGLHFDNFREIWTYRDWVIGAFNRNLPFDQFTVEQLAGDLLPNRTLDQLIASGFNRCQLTTNEGGTIPEENLVMYTRDKTETVAAVWLGMTANCAVCHDHKFDPLTTKDFYSMAAFFNNTTQGPMDGNIKDSPPVIPVSNEADRPRWNELQAAIPAAKAAVEARKLSARGDFESWLSQATVESLGKSLPQEGLHLHAPLQEGQGKSAKFTIEGQPRDVALTESASWQAGVSGQALGVQGAACDVADAGDFDRDQPFTLTAWVKLAPNDSHGAIAARMDKPGGYRGWDFWVQARRVGMHLISSWPEDGLKVVSQAQVPGNEWTHVAVAYDGSGKAAGVKIFYNGQLQKNFVENDKLQGTTRTEVPFRIGQRSAGEPLSGAGVGDLRIFRRSLSDAEVEALARVTRFAAILAKPADQRTDAEKNDVFPWWLGTYDAAYRDLTVKQAALEQELAAINARGTLAYVMNEKSEEAMAFILYRGEYDKRRDPVKPATPAVLPPFPENAPRNRLGFAEWLLRPEQPLVARVTVNRFWQELFGTGIVRTSGDLGVAGELPSHPQLLDWLALEFRDTGWDIKRFFKMVVMSSAYRQSAATTRRKLELDPQNRLLSRGPRFRMDAEMVRDYALAASGTLVQKLGGPSVKPYQPDGVWEAVAMIGSNTRDYKRDSGESLYRRSMYTFWKRAAPPASMEIFNAPSREFCTVRRERTNTPLQSLVTLNDPQLIEAARRLAQSALTTSEADDARLDFITLRLLSRTLRPQERAIVAASLAELLAHYRAQVEDAKQLIAVGETPADAKLDPSTLAAWTMVINELMNLDEVLTK